jgi:hypothetical protein
MSKYQELEDKVGQLFRNSIGKEITLSEEIKNNLGLSSTKISSVDSKTSKHHDSKTDVLVVFDDNQKLKISIKKDNAHYYGNWYTHQRISQEFGDIALQKLIDKTTEWANNWVTESSSSFFLGVSINFGERRGKTFMEFNDIFTSKDIRSIVQGYDLSLDTSANILLQTSADINTIEEVISQLQMFDDDLLNTLFNKVKIVFRPINPMTEGSNRGKQTYTKFVPNVKFDEKVLFDTKSDLLNYGKFESINLESEYKLNHNHLIKSLRDNHNVQINVK